MRASCSAYESAILVVGKKGKLVENGKIFFIGKFFSLEVGPP
jgi:hypothetical protein